MRVGGIYSFNHGQEVLEAHYAAEWMEVQATIAAIDAYSSAKKMSSERARPGHAFLDPEGMSQALKEAFAPLGWTHHKVVYQYADTYYTADYQPRRPLEPAFRDMEFVKNRVGMEVQLGKHASLVCSVCAKMTIFHKQNIIDVGIEVVPLKELADEMSSGVSYFEQFVWDLEQRGVADIDIPVLILGIVP